MVLARVSNVKSGWKSMFMVFTTAANDESPMIVRLAFDTVEKIVREHFDYITETEVRASMPLHVSNLNLAWPPVLYGGTMHKDKNM